VRLVDQLKMANRDEEKYDKTYVPGDEEEEEEEDDDDEVEELLEEEDEEEEEDVIEDSDTSYDEDNYYERKSALPTDAEIRDLYADKSLQSSSKSKFKPKVLKMEAEERERVPLSGLSTTPHKSLPTSKNVSDSLITPQKLSIKRQVPSAPTKSAVTSRKFTKVIINYFVKFFYDFMR
jgi:hypothetical protein